jgi:threonine dehydrogenase-like Zn-dependent dehydrogenase
MRAVVTRPGSGRAWLNDIPEPVLEQPDDVIVQMLRIGVCGTDRHVMDRGIGGDRALPTEFDYLVVGHEAVGRVLSTGAAVGGLQVGSLVVPTVRRGCGECRACAVGQADLCFTGRIRERGIVGLHGFLSEHIVERAEHLVPVPDAFSEVGPLVESLTTPEKALRRIANARAHLPQAQEPLNGVQRALVTGSGRIALLAVMALRIRDIPTWALARQPADGPAAQLVQQTGATYVELKDVDLEQPQQRLGAFDAIIEATGAAELAVGMLSALGPNGVLDLVGGTAERKPVPIQAAALGAMVGRNLTLLGSVNANMDDWHTAVRDLQTMRTRFPGAVEGLITHTFGMADVDVAFDRVPGQIKAIIDVART